MSVVVIIPAYNEAPRVGPVVRACLDATLASRVVVVDDGSRDATAQVAAAAGAEVLRMPRNGGKARAMDAGVEYVYEPGICFMDADLPGLRGDHIDSLIRPYLAGAKMVLGTVTKGQQILTPMFAGARVMSAASWRYAKMVEPSMIGSGYGIEVILACIANRCNWPVASVHLDGVGFVAQGDKWATTKLGRSLSMWGRVLEVASKVGGRRAYEDIFKPMFFNRGFINEVDA